MSSAGDTVSAAASAASAKVLALAGRPARTASAAGLRIGRSATPPKHTRASPSVPPSTVHATITATMAKSPALRENSVIATRCLSLRSGKVTAVSNSSGRSVVVKKVSKKSRAAIWRSPETLTAVTDPSRSAVSMHHSAAGSACATLPPKVPRVRIGRCPTYVAETRNREPSGPVSWQRSKSR